MSGFGSIDDLLQSKKTPSQSDDTQPQETGEVSETEKAFQKKMQEVGVKQKETETQRYAQDVGIPYIDLQKFPIGHEALRQVPEAQAREVGAICFFATQDEFRIGALDPTSKEVEELMHQVAERLHAKGGLYTISEKSFERVLELYKTVPTVQPVTKDVSVSPEALQKVQDVVEDFATFNDLLQKGDVSDLVTYILGAGLKLSASDVHIEAEEQGIVVRFRLDGVLQDAATLPRESYKKLVSRLKLVASLKMNVTDVPQDGRFTIKTPDGDIDVRVSTIPTVYGESIVMRLLVQQQDTLTLEGLGLRGRALERLQKEITRPNGMIITTGPTGSGKTTTLYAIMQLLNKPDVKIITLEDPVEYKMEGINQSQIDKSHDYTFAKGLKSMLRQDPDIAMVGEIRDIETAEIAIQASLTGHLMLSTIHTNDAFGAVARFLSMGAKPFLLAPALNCVIGQRLVRRLCESCKQPVTLEAAQKERIEKILADIPEQEKDQIPQDIQLYGPKGCEACNDVGYEGRIGIYEIFTINDTIEAAIIEEKAAEYEMRELAKQAGVLTMVQDGVLKALDGITSPEEVFRVIE